MVAAVLVRPRAFSAAAVAVVVSKRRREEGRGTREEGGGTREEGARKWFIDMSAGSDEEREVEYGWRVHL